MEERLQKILARAGYGSRRANEELIIQGRVTVNDKVAELGQKADPQKDRIAVDGKQLDAQESPIYIALHKPRNVLSAVTSPDRRQTVRDLVPVEGHIYPVGRLDVDSEGLILLTNDGELANYITHPRYGHEKEYRVLVARQPDPAQLEAWRHGVVLEDGHRTRPADVRLTSTYGKGAWLRVVLKEGRKRQIREMGEKTGLPVVRIIRTRINTLELGKLKPGEWRILSPGEVAALRGKPIKQVRQSRNRKEEIPDKKRPYLKPRSESPSRTPYNRSGGSDRPRGSRRPTKSPSRPSRKKL